MPPYELTKDAEQDMREVARYLLVTKYRYHYIFFLFGYRAKPIVIGVIHERRDIVSRLSERLT